MNPPKLPTDNLYKFISTLGLTMIVISSFFVLISSTEEMGSILNEKKNLILETTENKYEVQQIQQNKKINIDNIDSLKLKTLELEQKTNIIENKINTYQFKINFFKNIFNSGMAIMILGFILWYYKLQKFLDKMMKENSENNPHVPHSHH